MKRRFAIVLLHLVFFGLRGDYKFYFFAQNVRLMQTDPRQAIHQRFHYFLFFLLSWKWH
jgi:hypothetical protein